MKLGFTDQGFIAVKSLIHHHYLSAIIVPPLFQAFCVNLPSWSTYDQVICLAEMKLGFMAQGCMAPGFSTLMANLFVMRAYKKVIQNNNNNFKKINK